MTNWKLKSIALILISTGLLYAFTTKNNKMEIEKIKHSITENYVHGAFNETNIGAFKTIFHPEFSIINIQEDGTFYHFTRDMWEVILQKRLGDKAFDFSTIALIPEYKNVSISENKATVTLDLLLNGKVVYTDFLLLTKINNDWKIVSKIYHEH